MIQVMGFEIQDVCMCDEVGKALHGDQARENHRAINENNLFGFPPMRLASTSLSAIIHRQEGKK